MNLAFLLTGVDPSCMYIVYYIRSVRCKIALCDEYEDFNFDSYYTEQHVSKCQTSSVVRHSSFLPHTRHIIYVYIVIYISVRLFFCPTLLLKIGDEDLQNDLINELNEWKLNDFQHFTLELCIRFTTRFPVNGYLPLNVPPFITSYTKPKLNDS